jgi:hypothetical protein
MAFTEKLSAIGEAIRAKTGKEDLLTLDEMPTEIASIETGGGGGADLPEEALVITGNCNYRFGYNGWNWFIEEYGNKITTKDINRAASMFRESTELKEVPFTINCNQSGASFSDCFSGCTNLTRVGNINGNNTNNNPSFYGYMFNNCNNITEIGEISNMIPYSTSQMFANCYMLRELPVMNILSYDQFLKYPGSGATRMFQNCYSLRSIPEELLANMNNNWLNGNNHLISHGFECCYALDEVRGLNLGTGTGTVNIFAYTFSDNNRLKSITFVGEANGSSTHKSANWTKLVLDLTNNVGYAPTKDNILNYNSGITADKEVYDEASYNALKDDPDWFTCNLAYSRFNHDSAVELINTLPKQNYNGNSIKFKGESGSATDGGAINTLTAEEIAVATANKWTIAFV